MDIFSSEKRSEIMRSIPNKNTSPELKLRKALHALGLRYSLHCRKILGKPDIVFARQKVVVFVDGDWWHGRNFERDSHKYPDFWQDKIYKTIQRDKVVSNQLRKDGWLVLRFWQKEIDKDVVACSRKVMESIKQLLN
jgi:DNA mismatch endonuclease (patch repair protein)